MPLDVSTRQALRESIPTSSPIDLGDALGAAVEHAPGDATATVGSGTVEKTVTLQLKDAAGDESAEKRMVTWWLSDAAAGALTAAAPDQGVRIDTGAAVLSFGSVIGEVYIVETPDVVGFAVTDATGVLAIAVGNEGAAATWYMNFAVGGRVYSAAVTVGV